MGRPTPASRHPGEGDLGSRGGQAHRRYTAMTGPSEILTVSLETSLQAMRKATMTALITWIKRSALAQTHLPEDSFEFVAFWVS